MAGCERERSPGGNLLLNSPVVVCEGPIVPAVVRVGLALVPTDWSVLDLGLRTPLWVDWPVWRPDLYAGCEPCSGLSALIDLQTWHQPSPGGVAACF